MQNYLLNIPRGIKLLYSFNIMLLGLMNRNKVIYFELIDFILISNLSLNAITTIKSLTIINKITFKYDHIYSLI